MASVRQIAANRRNALESTGPRTTAGQRSASLNARKHGLRANEVSLPFEDRQAFEASKERLLDQICPIGELELDLAERVIGLLWRLRRIGRIEAELLTWEYYNELESRADDEASCQGEQELDEDGVGYTFRVTDQKRYAAARRASTEASSERDLPTTALGRGFVRPIASENPWHVLSRYEAALERSFFRNLHELQRLQSSRLGAAVPPPIAVDVTVDEAR